MAVILVKRNATAAAAPAAASMTFGELAYNPTDKKLWGSDQSGNPVLLGNGNAVLPNVATTFTKHQGFGLATLTDAETIAWDVSAAQAAKVTLGGNRTMGAPTNAISGFTYILEVLQDATGSRTLSWNSVFKWPGGTAPTLSTAANARDLFTFFYDGTYFLSVGSLAFA